MISCRLWAPLSEARAPKVGVKTGLLGALSPRELAQAPGELASSSRLSHLGRQLAHVRLFMGSSWHMCGHLLAEFLPISSFAGSLLCSEKVWATSHPQQPGLSRLQRLRSYSEDTDPSRNRWGRQQGAALHLGWETGGSFQACVAQPVT